jgi:AraC-like DNA-binding protein
MSELALNVGFMTAENFVSIFKEKYGMTPLEYRLKNKK